MLNFLGVIAYLRDFMSTFGIWHFIDLVWVSGF